MEFGTNAHAVAEGLAILAVIEEDDSINLLAAGLIHRSRELLAEAGVADEMLPKALADIITQVMTGDIVGKQLDIDFIPASEDPTVGTTVTVTLVED